jgi:outer membrane protein TolC
MTGIRRFASVFLCFSMMFASAGPAQDAPQPDPALEPVAPAQPDQSEPKPPAVDQPLTEEQRQMLQQKIDVGTIDVERLRELVDGPAAAERLRMTLQECIELALLQNPDIQITQLERFKSDADLMTAKGEFDPLLTGQAQYLRATQQANAAYRLFGNLTTVEAYQTTSSVDVGGKLHTGTIYDVRVDLNKEETTYNNFISEWSGGLTVMLRQPLLRGSGFAYNRSRIVIARRLGEVNQYQLQLSVMNLVAQVVKSYWDLVGAIENVTVREQSLANAERLMDISQRQLDLGTAAAIEVLQAKAGVAGRQSDLIAARSTVADAEDLLKQLLNMRDGGYFSSKRIVPVNRPSLTEFNLEDVKNLEQEIEQSINVALETRPEMLSAALEIQNAKTDRQRAANELLPSLDVSGSVFQGARDHYMREVFTGIRTRSDNSYTVGVEGSIPLGNRVARGQFQRAGLTLKQSEQRLESVKQETMMRVRMAMRALQTSQILIESNRQTRKLQETNVAAEEKRLKLGVTTSYRVLQVQQDLTLAQTQEVQSRIAFEKALVDLRLAEGRLLEELGVELEAPEPPHPVNFIRSVIPRKPYED